MKPGDYPRRVLTVHSEKSVVIEELSVTQPNFLADALIQLVVKKGSHTAVHTFTLLIS